MEILEKNILHTEKEIIVHQVNCLGRMGSGLAGQLIKKYENLKPSYKSYYNKLKKIGFENEDFLGLVHYTSCYDGKVVANIFGQIGIRENEEDKTVYTKKFALINGIQKVKEYAEKNNLNVAIPYGIGCGLAGGNWKEIKIMIDHVFRDNKVKYSYYKKN